MALGAAAANPALDIKIVPVGKIVEYIFRNQFFKTIL